MSTAALFPTSLYVTDSDILSNTLTRSEWQQVAVEVEAIEGALGVDPAGTSATVGDRFANYSTAAASSFTQLSGTLSAAQHGAITATSATHPFSALTGTLGTAQTSTAAASIYSFGGLNANSLRSTANSTLSILPVANSGFTTLVSLDVQAFATATTGTRTFVGHFGVTATGGSTGLAGDVVALYAGALAQQGTGGGNIWSLNTIVTIGTGASTAHSYYGYELDLNNHRLNWGDETGAAGIAPPSVYGLQIIPGGTARSVGALLITSPGADRLWNRGIVFYSAATQASIQDFGSPDRFLDVRGSPFYVLKTALGTTPSWLIYSPVVAPILFFGNLNMGAEAATAASETLCMANGGVPTAAIANALEIYSQDSSSGATELAVFVEQPVVTAAAAAGTGATREVKVRWNGEEYWMLMRSA